MRTTALALTALLGEAAVISIGLTEAIIIVVACLLLAKGFLFRS